LASILLLSNVHEAGGRAGLLEEPSGGCPSLARRCQFFFELFRQERFLGKALSIQVSGFPEEGL
jgi:hypothetical protein